ncbi:MAG: zinc dependent phospholipase C family protein, partial [Terriglobia bacterium]
MVACLLCATFLFVLQAPHRTMAYSVLAHEAIVDAAWDAGMRDLLLARFPNATVAQLREAHAYAYGGCIIQDMGYYPFGSHFFSDLTHYVRSADFILNMIRDSQNLDEYAFALGALTHYAADNEGHSIAVNHAVPLTYPRLRRKYGNTVTYEEDRKAHLLVEFSFDVAQVAGHLYPPQAYHDFLGFQVSKPLLDRAFKATYGFDIRDALLNEDLALYMYRHAASKLIPSMTRVAWAKKRDEIEKVAPGITRHRFVYVMSRSEYKREWGKTYHRPKFLSKAWFRKYKNPGILSRILLFIFELIPKVGPLRTLQFRPPTLQTEDLFLKSFKMVIATDEKFLDEIKKGDLQPADTNLDTGKPVRRGDYQLAGKAYRKLLDKLAHEHFKNITPSLKANILAFYASGPAPKKSWRHFERHRKTVHEIEALKSFRTTTA